MHIKQLIQTSAIVEIASKTNVHLKQGIYSDVFSQRRTRWGLRIGGGFYDLKVEIASKTNVHLKQDIYWDAFSQRRTQWAFGIVSGLSTLGCKV